MMNYLFFLIISIALTCAIGICLAIIYLFHQKRKVHYVLLLLLVIALALNIINHTYYF